MTFYEGATSLGTAHAVWWRGQSLGAVPTAGPGSVTAVYSGNSSDTTSNSPGVNVSVSPDTTKTVLAVTPAGPVVGQALTLKATVSVVSPGAGKPTGSVTFYDGTMAIGTVTLANASASLSMTYTSPGSHSFTASYSGDTNDNVSTTTTATAVTVSPDTTKTALAVTTATPVVGQAVTIKATVSVVSPGVGTPTGSVTFYDGATAIDTVALYGEHRERADDLYEPR